MLMRSFCNLARRGRARGERGSYLVLFALLLVTLVTFVAILIDLGQVRSSAGLDQSVADFSALAGGTDLASASYLSACEDMVNYINTNAGLGGAIAPSTFCQQSGQDVSLTTCSGGTETEAQPQATVGRYVVSIHFPVPASEIKDSSAYQSAGINDGTPCERMRVVITSTDKTLFGRVAGVSQLSATRSATVLGFENPSSTKIPALLTLERTDCDVVATSGQGAVFVKGPVGTTDPGIIHADSYGEASTAGVTECKTPTGGSTNANEYIVYGTSIPSGGWFAGAPSILAQGTSTPVCPNTTSAAQGFPSGIDRGLLDLVGQGLGHDAATVDTGVCPAPLLPAEIASRSVVDNRWNGTGNGSAVSALRNTAQGLISQGTSLAGAEIYPDKTNYPNSSCKNDSNSTTVTQSIVVVNCASYSVANRTSVTFSGTQVIFLGDVSVPSGGTLTFPGSNTNNTQVVVEGGGTGANANGVSVSGTLSLNLSTAANCTARTGKTANGGTTFFPYATLVINSGSLSTSGTIHLCQTFVAMSSLAMPQEITGTGTVEGSTCSVALPCPTDPGTGNNQGMSITGSLTDWTAPNQCDCDPTSTYPYEGLAFWTESGQAAPTDSPLNSSNPNSAIGANSNRNTTTGSFVMPNALFTFTGGSSLSQRFEAQFISRRLFMKGQGVLTMSPNPLTSAKIPVPNYELIR
jgi:hypothetical protein